MRKVAGCAAAIMLVAGLVEAQQAPSPATAIADLYRPFTAPPGDRTRADIAWPAATATLPAPISGIGRAASSEEIAGWDIAVRGDGHNLPPGSGTAKEGEELYVTHCAACHGDFGEGLERWPALMGGRGSLRSDQPKRTIGSFWQHAPAVFDYIRRAMPYAAPQSLSND
ncbi:MAG: c-type cytochrome, partial [Alphaproteobacteria bacterium]